MGDAPRPHTPGWIVTCPGPSGRTEEEHRGLPRVERALAEADLERWRTGGCPVADQHRIEECRIYANGLAFLKPHVKKRSIHA